MAMIKSAIHCPHCGVPVTLEHLRVSEACAKVVRSLCSLYSRAQRTTVTRAGGRPPTMVPCPRCGKQVTKTEAVRGHGCEAPTLRRTIPVTVMRPCWDVTDVEVVGPLTLAVQFVDGLRGIVRFEPTHLKGVFAPLTDPNFFAKVHVDGGAVTWPGEIDLAPDAMYDEIKAQGEWVLR